ncbi:sensor histidine kinase [Ideonella sp. BN130291]|uniref:sensor histidine kinase n=1 Tax=Ideonella sp. BN130291 TaxID=3112940 RepID=UPI002E266F56|nr:ATP-binding protein [Ideonella sp. BN130291]
MQHVASSPQRRGVVGVLAPVLLGVGLVAALAVASLSLLSALRAYSLAESHWSQARSQAVELLRDYARSRDPRDFARFERALQVPLSDRIAREELERSQPDEERARQGLLAGHNHPADVEGMLMLYRRFGSMARLQASLQAWREGDELIAQLRMVAEQMRDQMNGPWPQAAALDGYLEQISKLNTQFIAVEKRFTDELAQMARVVERVLIGSVLAIAVGLALAGLWLARRSLRQRAERERALAEATERWALAAEAGGLGLYDWVVARDELRMDAKAAALYGLGDGAGAVVRRATVTELLHPDDVASAREQLDAALRSGRRFKARYRVRLPDGTWRHLEATGLMQGDPVGGGHMVGVVRDVTEEERQTLLARQRDAAERAAQARMEFLSRLSHELRTPLNAILGFAQLLAIDHTRPLSEPQAQRVQLILDAGQQLLKLVEDVLDLTKIDAGAVSVRLAPVDVAAAARASLALASGAVHAFAVEVRDRMPQQPLWALADEQRLQQVFTNLLTNACKYNRRGGSVTLQAWAQGERVCVSIADTGRGITHAERAELFQPFRRLAATAGQVEGTGLGLFIVKSLLERMNGSIELESTWGEGSRFTVVLPASTNGAGTGAAPSGADH